MEEGGDGEGSEAMAWSSEAVFGFSKPSRLSSNCRFPVDDKSSPPIPQLFQPFGGGIGAAGPAAEESSRSHRRGYLGYSSPAPAPTQKRLAARRFLGLNFVGDQPSLQPISARAS